VDVIEDAARREGVLGAPHPAIPLPRDLYGPTRRNSRGLDLTNEAELRKLGACLRSAAQTLPQAGPLLAQDSAAGELRAVLNPGLRSDPVGGTRASSLAEIELALGAAHEGAPRWAAVRPAERARILEAAADRLEADLPGLMAVLIREAGKTASNAVAEVREAVDFLRYYGRQVREHFDPASHVPLGPVVCISPWNFPLAIFMGQVTAALAAGNVVLAKPSEQTPLIAAEGVRALWAAGVPRFALQLLPGRGSVVGAKLVADARVQGVLFTGSTEVARTLQASIAGRIDAGGRAIPLIAETGGQNAMIVDSSALPEQVVADVLASAFDSAGQRCSALRVLCVQEEAADRVLEMLLGAMAELRVGSPDRLSTDVGPVIDEGAKDTLDRHIDAMRARGRRVHQVARRSERPLQAGTFVLPTLIEIGSISELEREVFGPVLHFVRYRRDQLDDVVAQINGTGYGLTMGLHTRIDETIARVTAAAHAGNVYVNRNMVGAVVGVQPFGGEGLSGTGPKAGGPLYLYRLLSRRPDDVLGVALAGGAPAQESAPARDSGSSLAALLEWAGAGRKTLADTCARMSAVRSVGQSVLLPGPTGERNVYAIVPRTAVLCLADQDDDRLVQLAAVLAVGSQAIWPAQASTLLDRLPARVRSQVTLAQDWMAPQVSFDAVLLHGSLDRLAEVQRLLAQRTGPVVSVERLAPGETAVPLERLVIERAISINTAAAGGNASLMTID
jgi:RHH-type proline utilization regulon transcriptional repressor/proline dehydrogenase/delta 1-pyrroline-5-carboxylate dehydrogenase